MGSATEYLIGCLSTRLPFSFWAPLLKPNTRKQGTLIVKGPLRNLPEVPLIIQQVEWTPRLFLRFQGLGG